MDTLIIQVLNGNASRFEEERLRRWRESAPENEAHFQEMTQVWELTAPEPVVPVSGPPSVQEILAAAPVSLPLNRESVEKRAAVRRRPWLGFGLLAASLAAIGLGIQVLGPAGPTPLAIHQGDQTGNLTLALNDGSFVRLAEGSTLREWDVEGRREVSLDGRAFFAVARDEARPFVIRTGGGEVSVLGTRFQVDTDGDEVEAVVVEGVVRLSNAHGSVEVPAGSLARMGPRGGPVATEVEDVLGLLDWPDGILIFQATPLFQVVEEVSRHYGRTLQIDGIGLSQRRVTAWFQGEPFDAVVESLCVVTEAACRVDGENVTMGLNGSGGVR